MKAWKNSASFCKQAPKVWVLLCLHKHNNCLGIVALSLRHQPQSCGLHAHFWVGAPLDDQEIWVWCGSGTKAQPFPAGSECSLTPVGLYENKFTFKKLIFALSRTEHKDQHFTSSCLDDLDSLPKPKSIFIDSSASAWAPQTESCHSCFSLDFQGKMTWAHQKKGWKAAWEKKKNCAAHLFCISFA